MLETNTLSVLTCFLAFSFGSYKYAIPPVIPAPKFALISPNITATPPVIYSHPFDPQPSTTTSAPEFLTANLSPALPEANNFPFVAPYNTVFPIIVFF